MGDNKGPFEQIKDAAQRAVDASKRAVQYVKDGQSTDDEHHGTANSSSSQQDKFDDIYSTDHQSGGHNNQ